MKEIKAFVHPSKVHNIVDALRNAGFPNLTLTPSEGTGQVASEEETYPTLEFSVSRSKVVKLELVCPDQEEEKAVTLIQEKGKTGKSGDGIIYVSEVEKAYKVKTGEEI